MENAELLMEFQCGIVWQLALIFHLAGLERDNSVLSNQYDTV